jgi:hypothetical protein
MIYQGRRNLGLADPMPSGCASMARVTPEMDADLRKVLCQFASLMMIGAGRRR